MLQEDNQQAIDLEEVAKLASVLKTVLLDGIDEYENAYKRATAAGIDRREAIVEALKAQHIAQERLFLERAAQASSAGDSKIAALLVDAASHARSQAHYLANATGTAEGILRSYATSRSDDWLRLAGTSDGIKLLRKYGGPIGDAADLSLALTTGSDADVAKAVTGIGVGFVAGMIPGIATYLGGAALAGPAGIAAVLLSVGAAVAMEFVV